jgi:glycosyltransferase 2 family protein
MNRQPDRKKIKNILLFIVKAVVSLSILLYLLSRTELSLVYSSLVSAEPLWLVLAFFMLYIGKVITAYRWQGLLAAQGVKIPLRTLIASVFVGQFFNSFLPTTVGGDVVRAYDTAVHSKESMKSAISVFADRLIGVFALTLLAFLALAAGYLRGDEVGFYVVPVLVVFSMSSFGMLLIYIDWLAELNDKILRLIRMNSVADQLKKAYQSLHLLKDKPSVMINALVSSILLQINVILFYYFIGVSLDIGVSLLYFSMIVPIALVVLLVPFSINGIGIREGVFVFLLTSLGVESKDAIALSLISFGLTLTQGVIGGVIFALRGVSIRQAKETDNLPQEPIQ